MAQTGKLATALIGSGIGIIFGSACVFKVDAGERAIKFDKFAGVKNKVFGEGIHFNIPFLQTPIKYDIRCKPREVQTKSGTKDQQTVVIKLRILHHPEEHALPDLFDKYGLDYDERILPSIGNEILKRIVAQYNAEELITKRQEVSKQIRTVMRDKAKTQFGLILDDIALTDLQFGSEYMHAVEMKQVEQQEAERRQHLVQLSEYEKQASIIRASAEAEAATMIGQALSKYGRGLLDLRSIETQKDIIKNVVQNPSVQFVPNGVNMLLPATGVTPTPSPRRS